MAFATLGKQIDIHTGGVDNIATHHNGEIAQSESATGKQFSKYWMHSEHIRINDEKIAKSEGNGIFMKDLIEKGFSGDDYRYWLLTSHYRSPANFSFEALSASKQALTRLKRLLFEQWAHERGKLNAQYQQSFANIINNDLDTPKAIALLWDLVRDESISAGERKTTILEFDAVLGIGLSAKPERILESLGSISQEELPELVQKYILEREAARAAYNWDEADRLREAISIAGYSIDDSPQGPRITKK
jgi:cysteinyl-tRNA synthetase